MKFSPTRLISLSSDMKKYCDLVEYCYLSTPIQLRMTEIFSVLFKTFTNPC